MKKALLLLLFAFVGLGTKAQIVSISPENAAIGDEITVTYDATMGTAGLVGADKVYMHSGVILVPTELPTGNDWQNVVGNWGQDDGIGEMTRVEGEENMWQITLTPNGRSYYSLDENTEAFYLSMVFRNADGSAEGKGDASGTFEGGVFNNGDIFVSLTTGEFALIENLANETFLEIGQSIDFEVTTSNTASQLTVDVFLDNVLIEQIVNEMNVDSETVSYIPRLEGTYEFRVNGIVNGQAVSASQNTVVNFVPITIQRAIPSGLTQGVNYDENDDTKVTLVLLAPNKDFVYVAGTMNDWMLDDNFLMNQDTDNSDLFWLELNALEIGKEYIYQYWVEGATRIGDPYGEKVADPWNDGFIGDETYPDLITYERRDLGIATTFRTAQEEFIWDASEDDWERPNEEDLVIYEMLVRDFVGTHTFSTITDTIPYLKNLGINAIELMPIMEFEGNESWGYNVSYFFAPDKYYGTEDELKLLIQTAHQNGIAVILDMVLNHAFGQNALVQMFWDPTSNTVSEDSPWFNRSAPHPFSVGFDFNHESQYTRDFVDDVNAFWIDEFHFDGYRFDLSKGFTQQQSDESSSSNFDQSRVDNLTRMAEEVFAVDEDAYVILEHFTEASEEDALRDVGMLTWGNSNHDFRRLLSGRTGQSTGGLDDLRRVSYLESHDEERIGWELLNFGLSDGNYDIKQPDVYFERTKMGAAFFFTLPGPKMLWQFTELGYDIELNDDRLGRKPLPWGEGNLGYYEDTERRKIYDAYSAIIGLTHEFEDAFREGTFETSLNGSIRFIKLSHDDLNLVILGNFDTETNAATSVEFQNAGTWYDFFTDGQIELAATQFPFGLAPGEFHIFTDRELPLPGEDLVSFSVDNLSTVTSSSSLLENEILIYPTVSSDLVNVSNLEQGIELKNIELISLTGKKIHPKINQVGNGNFQFSMKGIRNGVYILNFILDKGVFQSKIIKK